MAVEGATAEAVFETRMEETLVPSLRPGRVMDNPPSEAFCAAPGPTRAASIGAVGRASETRRRVGTEEGGGSEEPPPTPDLEV